MARRAVIYIRTSSELQGEKCSPEEAKWVRQIFAWYI